MAWCRLKRYLQRFGSQRVKCAHLYAVIACSHIFKVREGCFGIVVRKKMEGGEGRGGVKGSFGFGFQGLESMTVAVLFLILFLDVRP